MPQRVACSKRFMGSASRIVACLGIFGCLACIDRDGTAAETVGWRHDGQGHFQVDQAPTEWSDKEGLLWKADLPATSIASPVVTGNHVLVMAEPNRLLCFRASDGSLLWERQHDYAQIFPPEQVKEITTKHAEAAKVQQQQQQLQKELKAAQDEDPKSETTAALQQQVHELQQRYEALTTIPPPQGGATGNTASTPVTDGQNVYALLGNGIASSHSLNGELQWMRYIEKPKDRHSASPVLLGDLLILPLQRLVALDRKTGEQRWVAAAEPRFGSPVIARVDNEDLIVTPSGAIVRGRDGKVLAEKLFNLSYCSPIVHDGVVYAVERGRTLAVKLSRDEEQLNAEVLWESRGAQDDRLASPVVHEGLLYAVTSNGILDVVDAKTGERLDRQRLDVGKGRVDPSISLADGHLYVHSTSGATIVLQPGKPCTEVAHNTTEGFSSSPYFAHARMFIRTPKQLLCVAAAESERD